MRGAENSLCWGQIASRLRSRSELRGALLSESCLRPGERMGSQEIFSPVGGQRLARPSPNSYDEGLHGAAGASPVKRR